MDALIFSLLSIIFLIISLTEVFIEDGHSELIFRVSNIITIFSAFGALFGILKETETVQNTVKEVLLVTKEKKNKFVNVPLEDTDDDETKLNDDV